MENWIVANMELLLKTIISIIVIFSAIIVIVKISGLRIFAKMSSIDFASTIAIGFILASVIMNTNQSLLKSGLALAGIIAFQPVFSYFVRKSKSLKSLLTNKPKILMLNVQIIFENLAKTNIDEENLIAKLREVNVLHFDEVLTVVLNRQEICQSFIPQKKKIGGQNFKGCC